ncbi:RDD family protein [Lentibacillus saliphilus]|uniref:RDD family protein n=1 Tax=Lentibacillus saliphilus TaxID=2737028 RepID=UPI001C30CCF0|nr:RDD family protein [Lentibacillus saliphilus]
MAITVYRAFKQEEETVPAGFWLRLAAWVIDASIVSFCLYFVKIVPYGAVAITTLLFSDRPAEAYAINYWVIQTSIIIIIFWLYYSVLESSLLQATIGKNLVKLKVVGEFEERIAFSKASGKFFLNILSLLCLGIGQAFALFTKDKQTLIDRLLDYRVVRHYEVEET